MEINMRMEDCKFFVDEEKRTVVCVIENTKRLVLDFFNLNNVLWLDDPVHLVNITANYRLEDKLKMPDRFTGKAVCAPEDTWDEEAGKLIAFNRAKYKLNTSFFKRAQIFVTEVDIALNNMISAVNEFGYRLEMGAKKREEHIKRLCPDFEEKNKEEH